MGQEGLTGMASIEFGEEPTTNDGQRTVETKLSEQSLADLRFGQMALVIHQPIDWPAGPACRNCHGRWPCRIYRWGLDVVIAAGWSTGDITELLTRAAAGEVPWSDGAASVSRDAGSIATTGPPAARAARSGVSPSLSDPFWPPDGVAGTPRRGTAVVTVGQASRSPIRKSEQASARSRWVPPAPPWGARE